MSTHQQFIFKDYAFDEPTKTLTMMYAIDDACTFTETYRFDFPFAAYNADALDRACQLLFFMAGVSYYKTFVPPEIVIQKGALDAETAAFFSKTYQRGLGEFWYVNKLSPNTPVVFPATIATIEPQKHDGSGQMVAVGGGKDSLVSIELLRRQTDDLTTWSLNHRQLLAPLVERIGLPHLWVERTWDPQLARLRHAGAYNGHVPISAIFACTGVIVAILSGNRDIVMSNEHSANEPTLRYRGAAINHQYSKSQEFERDFQQLLTRLFGGSIRYYSLLRPLSELRIAELFAPHFETYKDVFSSCNRAFIHGSTQLSWCGSCPKCAFVCMALAPFVDQDRLRKLWDGRNPLLDPKLEKTYKQLLGIAGDKPLDCVGNIQESRAAMHLCQGVYPVLQEKYQFELPPSYDFRKPAPHEIPDDVRTEGVIG